MNVPYVSSKTLWIGFDNIRSVTLKVKHALDLCSFVVQNHFVLDAIFEGTRLWWSHYLVIRS